MLVNSGTPGDDHGPDGEQHRGSAVAAQQLADPQWQDDVVHVCAHSEELAAIATLGSRTVPHHMAPPDVLTGRSVQARLRREVPVDQEAQRHASMAAAESRSAAAELCSNKIRRDGHPQAEAGRRFSQEVVLINSADHKEHLSQHVGEQTSQARRTAQ